MTQNQATVTNPSAVASSSIERLTPGLTREWLYDGTIVVYTLVDAHRETIDAWIDAFKADIGRWPAERPFLLMHDFSVKGVISTPYARSRAQELVDARPDVKGLAAIVFPRNSLMITMIQLFLSRQRHAARIQRAFPSREQGLAWLLGSQM